LLDERVERWRFRAEARLRELNGHGFGRELGVGLGFTPPSAGDENFAAPARHRRP
jgi:hypothetical protein